MPENRDTAPDGVTAPRGFRAAGMYCGVKKDPSKGKDLAIIASDFPCTAAGTFTMNRVKAAPVRVTLNHLRRDQMQAIVANSGNANACTGPEGIGWAKTMARETARALGLRMRQVGVCSTGRIGVGLPVEKIQGAIPGLVGALSEDGNLAAAEAIMTSDTVPKTRWVSLKIGGKEVRIGGIAKGAGMICPNMATMLCFLTTDANISRSELQRALGEAVEESFNRISVDGDMSTNDTVLALANGQAGNRAITRRGPNAKAFRQALNKLTLDLAKDIVRDGESTTKLVRVSVRGAATFVDARRVAEGVANSVLVKCAWHGNDPNWGRVMDAIGYSGARIREEMVDIYFNGTAAVANGMRSDVPEEKLRDAVSPDEFRVCIHLHLGDSGYDVYTTDLSPGFVKYNMSE